VSSIDSSFHERNAEINRESAISKAVTKLTHFTQTKAVLGITDRKERNSAYQKKDKEKFNNFEEFIRKH
jgi:hypothetical protein